MADLSSRCPGSNELVLAQVDRHMVAGVAVIPVGRNRPVYMQYIYTYVRSPNSWCCSDSTASAVTLNDIALRDIDVKSFRRLVDIGE